MPDSATIRRIGIALLAFVLAWIVASQAARLFFGSGNILVLVLAVLVALGAYLALGWLDRRRPMSPR